MTIQTLQASERDIGGVVRTVIELCKGRSNANGTVTLTANATTTTVPAPTCSENSVPLLEPFTANAAVEKGNGTMFVTPGRESFVITHANNGQTDRTFGWHVAS
jgi:hypothetical protein